MDSDRCTLDRLLPPMTDLHRHGLPSKAAPSGLKLGRKPYSGHASQRLHFLLSAGTATGLCIVVQIPGSRRCFTVGRLEFQTW
ncbi:hypothetical protein DAEQUDRAFT_722932 [Daedalea quercina L-15889]|uniref:Uncharacterized protein n=1 Tax=Daedalea quercina L-15889 TaxID=1314783 RepID=A0A165SNU6_9APHY|nr:hypothetical protein DAEQUDRAFT_722932 [Daedalea quercina L-15889]